MMRPELEAWCAELERRGLGSYVMPALFEAGIEPHERDQEAMVEAMRAAFMAGDTVRDYSGDRIR